MLVKYSPMRNVFDLKTGMDRIFEDVFGGNRNWPESSLSVTPPVDIEETENDYRISAEIPGIEKGDIKITLENNVLSISGEKKVEKEVKDENYHRFERHYGKFHRSFELPGPINREKIDADYKNGVLNITVPKTEESKPKQIEVKVK